MASKPTRSQLEMAKLKGEQAARKDRAALLLRLIDRIADLLRTAVIGLSVAAVFYCVALATEHLAGKDTNATIIAVAQGALNQWAAWSIAVVSTGGYWLKHRAHKKLLKELAPHIKELEQKIDRGRSSTGLDPYGQPKKKGGRS